MKSHCCIALFVLVALPTFATAAERPLRPVSTYSIVARDGETGQLGAAVQSQWFSVGSIVIWTEPGVGAVATQSFVDPCYGPLGLQLMRGGKSAKDALTALLGFAHLVEYRQELGVVVQCDLRFGKLDE
jgi:uncharacterized Ntn-hydrolase superfamily protein